MNATKKPATKAAKRTAARDEDPQEWTDVERAAMKERNRELKKSRGGKVDGEADLLAKLADMSDEDRAMGERIHEVIKAAVPSLEPKTWYGMPAYAKDGKIVCFFQPAAKFSSRYSTLGFNDPAMLDDGSMWPTSWALTDLTPANERTIAELVKKAAS